MTILRPTREEPAVIGTIALSAYSMTPGRSDDFDGDAVGVPCERFEVGSISCQHGSARFSKRYDEGVDRRSGSGESAQLRSASCRRFADVGLDDAGLQEAIRVGVASRGAVQRLDEHHRRDDGRPELLVDQCPNEGSRRLRARGQTRQPAAVEHEHPSAHAVE